MALTDDDLKALRLLMREEIRDSFERSVEPLRKGVSDRLRDMVGQMEGLYTQNEKREQEYLFIREQLSRQEKQLGEIHNSGSRHEQYFTDLDSRVLELENKRA